MDRTGNGNLFIKNAARVVTPTGYSALRGRSMSELTVLENGAVAVQDGVIREVGPTADLASRYGGRDFPVLDAAGKTVLPGFVDPHTHLVFAGERVQEFHSRLAGASYMSILAHGGGILSTVRATRAATEEELFDAAMDRLQRMLSFGVTTVEAKSGYGLDRDTEIRQLRVLRDLSLAQPVEIAATFLGAHARPPEYAGRTDRYIDFIGREVLPLVVEQRLAEFCDVFCENEVFPVDQARTLLRRAGELGLGLKLHADEMAASGGAELAAEMGAVSADHLLRVSDRGIRSIAESGVVGVLLPGTAFCLREPYARARAMIDDSCAVALATDFNPGTFFSESLPLVCALAVLHMGMSMEEVITAITLNAAAAIGRAERIGSIEEGKQGDLVILEHPSHTYIPYHTGVSCVQLVVKRGTVVFERGPIAHGPVR